MTNSSCWLLCSDTTMPVAVSCHSSHVACSSDVSATMASVLSEKVLPMQAASLSSSCRRGSRRCICEHSSSTTSLLMLAKRSASMSHTQRP